MLICAKFILLIKLLKIFKGKVMRSLAIVASVLFSLPTLADSIDLGQASKYNAFVKENYSVNSSDVEGRVAIGGDLTIDGGYDIGTQIIDYGMGDGPSLVVGGNITKTGSGNFNVYQSATLPNPVLGDVVLGGTLTGGPSTIGTISENSASLPVDFDNAFAHLESLSEQLSQRTASEMINHSWALEFKVDPNVVPEDGVYVFNITDDQLKTNWGLKTDWYVNTEGMAADATVVFNVSNKNGDPVDFTQSNVFLTNNSDPYKSSDPLSGYFNKGAANNTPPVQVLYNFYGASQLNLKSDLYGSILAPTADIKAIDSVIWGQVIGKSWEGNMQINYNPFDPVGETPTPVPEPASAILLLLALALMLGRKKLLAIKLNSKVNNNGLCLA